MWADRKPVRSVDQNRFRASAGPSQHSTQRQLRVKCKVHASKQRTECGALKFSPCYIFLTQTRYLHYPPLLLFIAKHIPFKCHLSRHHMEIADSGQYVDLIYLQSLKPDVPSGPVGWRITWLFGRPGSDVCRVLRWAGLKKWQQGCVFSFIPRIIWLLCTV